MEKSYKVIGVLEFIGILLASAGILFYNFQYNNIETFLLLLFSISVLLVVSIWRKNKLKFYKREYEFEKEKNVLLKHYKYLSKYANDIILLVDEKGFIKQANEKAVESYGYSMDELLSMSGRLLRPEELRLEYDGIVNDINSNEGKIYETIHQRKNGEKFPVEISLRQFNIKGSRFFQAIIRDVSERKKAERKIREHSIILDSVGQAVIATDLKSKIIFWNKAAEQMYEWTKNEVLGLRLFEILPEEITKLDLTEIYETLTSGKVWSGESFAPTKNGKIIPIKITDTPIYNSDNELIGMVSVSEDLTEQKAREKELLISKEKAEEINKLKTVFLANMSHEVRTPLIGILGYAEMILEENYDAELKEKVSVIYKSGKKLNETLDSILDISKIEADKVEISFERFNLNEIINESIILYKIFAEEKGIALKYLGSTNGLSVELDKKMFSKIINNLLSNTIKYTNEGEVVVSASHKAGRIKIEIADTGIGIPESKLNLVFEPFRQVSEGYNRKFEGTGLGLKITKMLVEKMQGKIYLASAHGRGTRITVELPVYKLN